MLKKYLYPIVKNKKLKNWLKFWYLQGQKVAIKLIKLLDVTSPVTLNNTIKDTRIKIDILGNTSQDSTPTPENEVPIHVVKGHNEILYQNRNLFDKDKNIISNYAISTSTGEIIYSRGDFYQEIYIKVKSATKYVISSTSSSWLRVIEYDSAKNFIKGNSPNASVITTTSNTKYVRITTSLLYINSIQFEEGSVATSYVPHEEQTLELDLPEGMEMCKLGDYADTFEKVDEKWYKSKNVFKYTFTGTESWIYRKDQGHDRFDIIFVENLIMGESGTNLMLSTYFKSKYALENQVIFISRTDNYISVIFDGKVLSSFKEWLTIHNLDVYCVLSTPTLEEITDETLISQLDALQKAKAYDEQTNIIITAEDLEPKLNIEYLEKEVII